MELYQKVKNKFPYLSDEKLAEILTLGEFVNLKEGEVFIEIGSRTHKVGIVIEGLMRNYIINDNGEQVTVVFATEMQAITPYATVFLNKPASETTEAVEPSVLFVFDYDKIKSRIDTDPLYARVYANLMENTLVAAIERIEDFTHNKPEQRYQRLMEIHGNLIDRVPLKYLASYLGVTAVSLSRIRKRLAQKRN